ncbi:hypothetical protein [Piscinibacter terrae]|uniref:Uncharacterized protein n=1 Tax=Piscinibacter terrae TaxID=2496871 RepID=A0A3N7HQB0_9BURK|nr:hypothetical protein [Albitalea terrae]RQP24418.1 hypothetical protein DZC73_14085 [Albitalea terrae]
MMLFRPRHKPAPASVPPETRLLDLADSFILKCIDELDPRQEARLREDTPQLQRLFNHTGGWEDIVMSRYGLVPEVRGAIRALWSRSRAVAVEHDEVITPQAFARAVLGKMQPHGEQDRRG